MKSIMNHNFSQIPTPSIERSTFDRTSGLKTAFNAAQLVPMFCDEILPGDTMKMNASFLARLSSFIFPIMDNIFLETFWFFVPCRILWDNWEKFNGAQAAPGDSIDYTIPVVYNSGGAFHPINESLYDYFGIPTQVDIATADRPSALPFRAYNMIWNEWFRDQNLQSPLTVSKGNGPDDYTLYNIAYRGKRHDYFSSCLPFPQKGASVQLPFGTTAPVIGNNTTIGFMNRNTTTPPGTGTKTVFGAYTTGGSPGPLDMSTAFAGLTLGQTGTPTSYPTTTLLGLSDSAATSGMIADLSAASAVTINQLRTAFAYQSILERDARGGTRYTEMLKSRWGIAPEDFRLQRPEYLGGSSQRINISQVPQTSQTDITPQANVAAYSVSSTSAHWNKSFTEHGYVIGLVNVRADITYQNGMPKMFSRKTRFDFYTPELAHLGEQAVMTNEIHYPNGGSTLVFGYQERWAEYRYKPSSTSSFMRSNHPESLDAWHLALDFNGTPPTLNDTFITDRPPLDRVLVFSEVLVPEIIMDCYFGLKHTRPLPTYSVPGLLGRF